MAQVRAFPAPAAPTAVRRCRRAPSQSRSCARIYSGVGGSIRRQPAQPATHATPPARRYGAEHDDRRLLVIAAIQPGVAGTLSEHCRRGVIKEGTVRRNSRSGSADCRSARRRLVIAIAIAGANSPRSRSVRCVPSVTPCRTACGKIGGSNVLPGRFGRGRALFSSPQQASLLVVAGLADGPAPLDLADAARGVLATSIDQVCRTNHRIASDFDETFLTGVAFAGLTRTPNKKS